MTNTRNMEHLAKYAFLAESLTDISQRYLELCHKHVNVHKDDPYYWLTWGHDLYRFAARWKFLKSLAHTCQRMHQTAEAGNGPYETTLAEMRSKALEWFGGLSAAPRTSHPSHNIVEQYLLEEVLSFIRGGFSAYEWFRGAQERDPEWRAWFKEEQERVRKAHEEKRAAEEAHAKAKEAARNRVRAAVGSGSASMADLYEDVMLGWETTEEVERVRNEDLRAFIVAAGVYVAQAVRRKAEGGQSS